MNCVLIETSEGRYCHSHQTWHERLGHLEIHRFIDSDGQRVGPDKKVFTNVTGPALYELQGKRWPAQHSCTNDPDGTSDTCPACLDEGTHD